MKFIHILKNILSTIAIIYLFFDIKIAIILFLIASILFVVPLGIDRLFIVIIGYLAIGGFICLFINWKIGILLFIACYLVTKFRTYNIKINKENYENKHNK